MFGVTGDWSTAALEPGTCYNRHIYRWYAKGVAGFTAAWARETEKMPETRQLDGERGRRGRRGRHGKVGGDRRKLETFQSRFDWTDPGAS